MPLLTVKNLSIHFHTREGITQAVNNVSFSIAPKEILGIVGESGSGKSVSCYSLLGLVPMPPGKIASGEITYQESGSEKYDNLLTLSTNRQREIRGGKISIIFQDPMTSLNPFMTVGKQISEAITLHHTLSKAEAKKRSIAALEEVGIREAEKRYHSYPHEFSGGMRQRVMIAMALATEPDILIADEPTTALDVTVQAQILALLKRIQEERQLAIIFITHDLAVIKSLADHVVVMEKGNVVETSTCQEVFESPKAEYTQKLIAAIPNEAKPDTHRFTIKQPEPLIEVNHLVTRFTEHKGIVRKKIKSDFIAVNDVSFDIQKGEILGLVGESGSGKSTLGRSLIRLIECSSGRITFEGKNLRELSEKALFNARKDFQMIFQDPYASLNPRMTVFDTLAEPLIIHKICSKESLNSAVNSLMDDVGLARSAIRKYPHEFSGGQRQRIAIARAISLNPKFIVADEPVSALDVTIQAQILDLLLNLTKEKDITMLFISHDLSVVRYMCDRVMVMQEGKIVEINDTETLYASPSHDYTKKLLSAIPIF